MGVGNTTKKLVGQAQRSVPPQGAGEAGTQGDEAAAEADHSGAGLTTGSIGPSDGSPPANQLKQGGLCQDLDQQGIMQGKQHDHEKLAGIKSMSTAMLPVSSWTRQATQSLRSRL